MGIATHESQLSTLFARNVSSTKVRELVLMHPFSCSFPTWFGAGDCSGHGTCKLGGTCECDESFGGPDCFEAFCPGNCKLRLFLVNAFCNILGITAHKNH